ncbi:hypothetical protein [Sphingosinicella sp. CPCC 101087]|uniref:hypothetical protein n=1 Tax=Sphingosinicella sp. CPCC 101087 TaxID=2497754 RepID=UPI00101C430F|nr:hypothetical protein [Sphingosinicella sp. CPCC 101087]
MKAQLLLVALAIPIAGCAKHWIQTAKNECTQFGFVEGTTEHAECVQRQFQAQDVARIQRRLADAVEENQSRMPPREPAPMLGIGNPPAARFLQRDHIDGMNRICVYDTLQGQEAVTISATRLCPIT